MASKRVHVSACPGQGQVTHDGTLFRLTGFPDASPLRWIVYGGEDGQVLVYKPEIRRWEILVPTVKANDYLFVSIAKQAGKYWQPYVHTVILHAFQGPPPTTTSVAKHLNDNPRDNCATNLSWGTKSENAAEAHRHRRLHSAPLGKRIPIPLRREVYDELREIGPGKGRPLEDFAEGILVAYIREHRKPALGESAIQSVAGPASDGQ